MNDIISPRQGGGNRFNLPRPSLSKGNVKPALPAGPPAKPPVVPQEPINLPTPHQPPLEPKPKKRRLKWILIALLTVVVAVGVAVAAAYFWYNDNLKPKSDSSAHIQFKVESGASADAVATKLEQSGLVRSSLAVLIYMKLNGATNVKSGSYMFAPNQTPQEIVDWLNQGRVDTFKVTIIPGNALAKVRKALIAVGYSSREVDDAFAATYNHPLFAGKPPHTSLEGYIYPDTYFVTSDTSVKQLLRLSFDEFEKQIEQNKIREQLAAMHFTLHQGITLASIIEKEVSHTQDRRQVAQVFEKRLHDGMMLGSDVTYIYAASLLGVQPTSSLDSPYNTRKYKGLPPGPISNFSMSALDAVVHPASGSYLYFVAGDDGNTYFAYTLAEHQANVNKYCHELCSQ